MKWSATDADRLYSATNCAKGTSDFVRAEDGCAFTAKNDVISMCVFALVSFILRSAVARCIFTS